MTSPRYSRSLFAGLAVIVLGTLAPSVARCAGYAPGALFGLRGIEVIVEDLDKSALSAGLTEERLTTAVLLRLQKAGIPVLKSGAEQKGDPYLYVRVSALEVKGTPSFAYTVEVQLKQSVFTYRNSPYIRDLASVASAVTGADSMIGYAGRSVFVGSVIDQVEEYIDKFALAYLNAQAAEKVAPKPQ